MKEDIAVLLHAELNIYRVICKFAQQTKGWTVLAYLSPSFKYKFIFPDSL